jgi:hypothetical protein
MYQRRELFTRTNVKLQENNQNARFYQQSRVISQHGKKVRHVWLQGSQDNWL